MNAKLTAPMIEVLRNLVADSPRHMHEIKAATYRALQARELIGYVGTRRVITDAGRAALANLDATPAKRCGTITGTGIHENICQKRATGPDGMCTRCRNFFAPRPHRCQMCGTDPASCMNNTTKSAVAAPLVTVTPVTETTAESLAMLAVISAATDTERPAVPVVLPGQRVRITGGRFAGIETTPSMIQPSGWLEFTTNSPRGFGIKRQVVAPGNWELVPYSTGLHAFNPTSGGVVCVTPCLRPDGTVQPCGDPVKGAIHDPQAYAAYATELTAELARWVGLPAADALAHLDAAAPKIAEHVGNPTVATCTECATAHDIPCPGGMWCRCTDDAGRLLPFNTHRPV